VRLLRLGRSDLVTFSSPQFRSREGSALESSQPVNVRTDFGWCPHLPCAPHWKQIKRLAVWLRPDQSPVQRPCRKKKNSWWVQSLLADESEGVGCECCGFASAGRMGRGADEFVRLELPSFASLNHLMEDISLERLIMCSQGQTDGERRQCGQLSDVQS